MKKVLSTVLALAFVVTIASCRETEEKKVEIEVKAETDEAEGRLESIGKSIDNAVEETKEAGESVEEAVEEVDNDDNS
ncbi:hypothetical protein [Winogradskyella sp. A3E31]|uniref:hypothetical protein n=1 Tax=Winogradskyella sp. A3E31 TaxID=3349637 RepID=UPI00398B0D90